MVEIKAHHGDGKGRLIAFMDKVISPREYIVDQEECIQMFIDVAPLQQGSLGI